jgi:dTDP-4-dehydrorhamnose 3,5-epimerase
MQATPTAIADVFIFEPKVFGDERGLFMESFNQKGFDAAVGSAPGH